MIWTPFANWRRARTSFRGRGQSSAVVGLFNIESGWVSFLVT